MMYHFIHLRTSAVNQNDHFKRQIHALQHTLNAHSNTRRPSSSSVKGLNIGLFDHAINIYKRTKRLFHTTSEKLQNSSVVSQFELQMVIHAFVSSRLDDCSPLFTCLSKSPVDRPQPIHRMLWPGLWLRRVGQITSFISEPHCTGFWSTSESILRFWSSHMKPFMVSVHLKRVI